MSDDAHSNYCLTDHEGPCPPPDPLRMELGAVIDEWLRLNSDGSYHLADRVLYWLAQREWCDCPAFPGIVRERDTARAVLKRAENERDQLAGQTEAIGEFLQRLRADITDEADWIDARGGMISAAWVADAMRHLATYGHRRPRKGEGTHIHHGDTAVLSGGAPELNRLASSGSGRHPTDQMLTQVPRVGPHRDDSNGTSAGLLDAPAPTRSGEEKQ
jgi:hypothetical protein